jgi:hypothetical protein
MMIDAFQAAFHPKEKVRLAIVFSGNSFPFNNLKNIYLNETFKHLLAKGYELGLGWFDRYYGTTAKRFEKDDRVTVLKGDISEQRILDLLSSSDCLVDTSYTTEISPVVLNSVALGKKPILSRNNAYQGYFDERSFIPVDSEKKTGALFEPLAEPLIIHQRLNTRYYLINKIQQDSLTQTLRDVYQDKDRLRIDEPLNRDFLKEHDWMTIAEKFKKIAW